MQDDSIITLKGYVRKKLSSPGSKSEHIAYYLISPKGRFLLRRYGQNAFETDKFFGTYEGQTVICSGVIDDYVLFVNEIKQE